MKHSYLKITCISISLSFAFLFVSVASGQTSSSGLIWVYTNAPDITSRSPVLVLDRTTRTEIKRFYPGANWSGLGPCMYGRGIAYDPRDGNLWVAMNRGACGPDGGTQGDGLIHKINSWDGSDLGSIPDPTKPPTAAAVSLGAMDYDAQENVLYGVSSEGVCYEDNKPCYYRLFKLNADTGSVIWRVELNDPAIFHPHTLAVKRDQTGRKVLSLNYGYVSTENGQILTAFNSSTGLIGLDIDEATGEEISAGGTRDDISIQDGRCDCETIQRPPTQTISSGWPFNPSGTDPNWSMLVQVTDNDGLVLRDIKLGQRYMAEKISVPYYYLETTALPKQRGELKPAGTDASMRSRLVNYYTAADDEKLVIEATYVIDQIPAGSPSCLYITQRYEFYRTKPGDNCEPSSTLPCSRWKPIVKYQFIGRNGGDSLRSINIAQRQHRTVDNNLLNSVGLFRDSDGLGEAISHASGFTKKYNPLTNEWYDTIIIGGKDAKQWDNVHQTFSGIIDEPGVEVNQTWPFIHIKRSGCPECAHSHWRWGKITGLPAGFAPEGNSKLIGIPLGSNQDVDFGVVAYQSGEEHPLNRFSDVVNGLVQYWQPIRTYNTAGRNPLQIYRDSAPEDVVYWQSGTGYQAGDTFFGYGSFFNPSMPNQQLSAGTSAAAQSQKNNVAVTSTDSVTTSGQDGVTSIVAAQLFAAGSTTIAAFDATLAVSLPAGYSQYSNLSYDVTTTAEASGPDTLTFCIPSITDQTVFNNFRIFHLEQDPYDPTKASWVDRTVLAPDPQGPDFANRTVNARANSLGQFVGASLTQPQPPNTAVADVAVSSTDSPDGVVVENDLTYSLTVTNNGPQTATGVVFSDALPPQTRFVSVSSTQGTCTEADNTVVCKLDTIAAVSNAIVTIVVKPSEGATPLPTQGKIISNTAFARANETDPTIGNNSANENTTILPDGNAAPAVKITNPTVGALFVSPANLNLTATASDSDGSVSKVDFYGDGNLIGAGTFTAPDQYGVSWDNVSFGPHSLIAVVTDNLNKTTISDPVMLIVNGSATVDVTSPANNSAFNRPANITITANAVLNGGTINKVDFYLDGFILLGSGTLTGPAQYSLTWTAASSGKHVLTAVATDNSNVTTTSTPVNIIVNSPPLISLTAPAGGAVFSPAPANITLTANANDGDGSVTTVDFYANGSLIGNNSAVGLYRFNFNWPNVSSGSYSVTAVATDNGGATATSAPVTIRVNAPPTVSITSPASGTQFTALANIALTANAADTDGSVGTVDFFANGSRIGSGAPIGGGQYRFTWSGVGTGSYSLSAVATDNEGATTSSNGPSVTVTSPALFVTGSTTLNSTETTVKARLEALNHTVIVKSAASAVTADANGKALVIISSTVSPTAIGTKFRTVAVPVLTWESGIYNSMGMTSSTNKDFGTKTNQTQVTITNTAHPLATGLSGTITVASSGIFNWGKPNANAASIAIVVGDTEKKPIFGYESGAVMPGLTAPARRVGFFMNDTTALNSSGIALLDAAIRWARGGS